MFMLLTKLFSIINVINRQEYTYNRSGARVQKAWEKSRVKSEIMRDNETEEGGGLESKKWEGERRKRKGRKTNHDIRHQS